MVLSVILRIYKIKHVCPPTMSTLDWINLTISLAGLYLATRGDLERIRRNRKLPKLIKDREFYERLHISTSAQLAYLIEAVLTVCAIAGGAIMLTAIENMPPETPAFSVTVRWVAGGAIYFLAVFKLSRYYRATTKYENTMARLNEEISKLEANPAVQETLRDKAARRP